MAAPVGVATPREPKPCLPSFAEKPPEHRGRRRAGGLRGGFVALIAALSAACESNPAPGRAELGSRDAESAPEELRSEASDAISRLRSPFCPGLMLEVCPSHEAEALRDSIQMLAENGLDADSLVEWMIASHGEEYRAFPKRDGVGLLAWAMPPAALLAGLGLVVVALRRLKGAGKAAEGAARLTEEERDRLDAALAQLEATEEAES
ncbi:MAG: cytochrome c-type biogenesis protein CcmH [Gemmatimonadota bacterium]|nr:cytochrome c-type biogenesis protein CcmH [Gemmatimonadota bacterium]